MLRFWKKRTPAEIKKKHERDFAEAHQSLKPLHLMIREEERLKGVCACRPRYERLSRFTDRRLRILYQEREKLQRKEAMAMEALGYTSKKDAIWSILQEPYIRSR